MSCSTGRRHGSYMTLLWLWRRPVATAPIRPLAWEPPYAAGAAQEIAKKRKKKYIETNHNENTTIQEFPLWLSGLNTPLVSMRMQVQSLVSLTGLRIQHCRELWFRSLTWPRSGVAMAVAGSCGCNSNPSLGTSICCYVQP